MRFLWLLSGWVSLSLGVVGIVLPLLPTTPFVLVAVYCFGRSSDRLHSWLINHPIFGPLIENWRRHRAIARSAKIAATIGCAIVFAISLILKAPLILLLLQAVILTTVLIFIWRCAEPG